MAKQEQSLKTQLFLKMGFKKTKHQKKGFTLLELLIASSIICFLLIVIVGVYMAHFRIFSNQNTSINVATQNKLGLDEVVNQIRESAGVVVSCANPPCNPTETNSSTVLVLQIWPLDATGNPIDPGAGTNYDYIIYKKNASNNLIKKIVLCTTSPCTSSSPRKGGTDIMASNVSSLQFVYYDVNDASITTPASYPTTYRVAVTIDTTATNVKKTFTTSQSATAEIRNK